MIIVCSLLSFAYAYAVVMGQDLKNLWTIWDQKKTLFFQQKVYGLERWLTNCSKAKMKVSSSQASSSLVGCFASP